MKCIETGRIFKGSNFMVRSGTSFGNTSFKEAGKTNKHGYHCKHSFVTIYSVAFHALITKSMNYSKQSRLLILNAYTV
jgi:hypothetical protein